ncbi:hypothetical protein NMY22_g16366 [Coprinellus aureogranulatus]|nr:hypothetical protein NMY22_g16366 [Coprinellus aureogranulatus]
MGVRAAVFVCITSFLLGALFTHWIADSLTLWKSPVTDEHLWTAASYYSIIAKGPVDALYFLAAVVLLGATTILWSLNDFQAENILFDGGSIYITSKFSALPALQLELPFPKELRQTTLELASNHLICSVALTGVVILQAGRLWAEKADEDEDDFVMVEPEAELMTTAKSSGVPSRAKTPEHDIVKPLRVETTN